MGQTAEVDRDGTRKFTWPTGNNKQLGVAGVVQWQNGSFPIVADVEEPQGLTIVLALIWLSVFTNWFALIWSDMEWRRVASH
jgi:hypothetical protein